MRKKDLWCLVVLSLTAAPVAGQNIYEVDTTSDNLSGQCTDAPNDCSLRGAISSANNDGSDSQVVIGDGVYQLTRPGADEDFNASGDLDITAALEIVAASEASPVIEQTVSDRVIEVHFGGGTIRIAGPITISGGRLTGLSQGAAILADGSSTLELEQVTLSDHQAEGQGGCLYYAGSSPAGVSLTQVTLRDCHSQNLGGGARLLLNGTQVAVTSSVFESNTSYSRGGGLYSSGNGSIVILDTSIRGNAAGHATTADGQGGGIYLSDGIGVLRQSTVSGNQAGVATTMDAAGGGVYVVGSADVTFENSTVSGNRTEGGNQFGAGIYVGLASSGTLEHATIASNSTQGTHAIYFLDSGGTSLTIKNSIVDEGCSGHVNSIASGGFNVERPWDGSTNTTCNLTNPSDLEVLDLMLRPLAGYGGPTCTHALLPGSPAQLVVSSAQCQSQDQRHAVRQGLFCDAGAYDDSSEAPGPWIFSDGYESGDTAAWSSVQ